jgi:hypothetical protein
MKAVSNCRDDALSGGTHDDLLHAGADVDFGAEHADNDTLLGAQLSSRQQHQIFD